MSSQLAHAGLGVLGRVLPPGAGLGNMDTCNAQCTVPQFFLFTLKWIWRKTSTFHTSPQWCSIIRKLFPDTRTLATLSVMWAQEPPGLSSPQVVFLPLLVYQTLVDIAAGDVVIPIKGNIQKPIVVSKIKINLDSRMNAWVLKCFIITHLANIRNINLSMLIMGECSNIYY